MVKRSIEQEIRNNNFGASVDTGGFQVGPVHHEEGLHEREPSRLDDEAAGETEA